MKIDRLNSWVAGVFLLAGVGFSAGLSARMNDSATGDLVLQEADSGRTFIVVEGQRVVVRLDSNPSTGYGWRVVATDKSLGYPQESYEPSGVVMPGSGGVQTFTWETKGPFSLVGEHQVKLAYLRPWETSVPPVRQFAFNLKILPYRPGCGNPDADPSCQKAKDEASCTLHGGHWTVAGLAPTPSCICPTVDAGCPCASPRDCMGMCTTPWGSDGACDASAATCSAVQPMFGCFCMVMEDGQAFAICVD